MGERPNFLEQYDRLIPEQYRDAGWRVLVIASGGMVTGTQVFTAVLQNEASPRPNGYFHSTAKAQEGAVDRAVQKLLETVQLGSGFTWYDHSDVMLL